MTKFQGRFDNGCTSDSQWKRILEIYIDDGLKVIESVIQTILSNHVKEGDKILNVWCYWASLIQAGFFPNAAASASSPMDKLYILPRRRMSSSSSSIIIIFFFLFFFINNFIKFTFIFVFFVNILILVIFSIRPLLPQPSLLLS